MSLHVARPHPVALCLAVPMLASTLLVGACGGPAPSGAEELTTSVYALVETVDGVSFGPPLGPEIAPAGPFDAGLLSRLQVVLEATSASGQLIPLARFDQASEPGLKLLAAHELYFAHLRGASYFTDPALAYRFRVLLDGREIGRSDMSDHIFVVLSYVPEVMVGVKIRIEDRPPPVVSSLQPVGAIVGAPDLELTVAGSAFASDSVVRFGTAELATTRLSSTELHAHVPATLLATPGPVEVTVVTPAPGGGASSATFTVGVPPISLLSISPATGSAAGNTRVTITGTNFNTAGNLAVTIGAGACTDLAVLDAMRISCSTPPGSGGAQDVGVVSAGGAAAILPRGFTYVPAGSTILLLHMEDLTDATGDHRTISVSNAANVTTARARFGARSFTTGTNWNAQMMVSPASRSGTGVSFVYPGDFTIEAFVQFTGGTTRAMLFSPFPTAGFGMGITPSTGRIEVAAAAIYSNSMGSPIIDATVGASVFAPNVWHYIAVKRLGTSVTVWVDGVQRASGTYSATLGASGQALGIGNFINNGANLLGYIDEFRITQGFARDVSVVPTSAFVVD